MLRFVLFLRNVFYRRKNPFVNGCWKLGITGSHLIHWGIAECNFYPRDAMLARVIVIATCPSVCLPVRHAPVLCQNEES